MGVLCSLLCSYLQLPVLCILLTFLLYINTEISQTLDLFVYFMPFTLFLFPPWSACVIPNIRISNNLEQTGLV
jgi:hypothetical protein